MTEQEARKIVGNAVNYHGRPGTITNVNLSKKNRFQIKQIDGVFDVDIPPQFDIEITFTDGEKHVCRNAQIAP